VRQISLRNCPSCQRLLVDLVVWRRSYLVFVLISSCPRSQICHELTGKRTTIRNGNFGRSEGEQVHKSRRNQGSNNQENYNNFFHFIFFKFFLDLVLLLLLHIVQLLIFILYLKIFFQSIKNYLYIWIFLFTWSIKEVFFFSFRFWVHIRCF
jgi:hypothetical protein